MSIDSIEKLYKHFGVLADAKDKISEHETEYIAILAAVKGSEKEKRLASQFIARFFKYFPNLAEQAIVAQLDLCEDGDLSIRKQAIKDLPSLCKNNPEHTQKIADILAQLLQSEDPTELAVVQNSLMTVIKLDPKGALGGIFSQVINADEGIRERCLKFLASKIKHLGNDIATKDVEDLIITESKKVLDDVTCEEFHTLMSILSHTRLGRTVEGNQQLIDIIAEQSDLNGSFNIHNEEDDHKERLLQCLSIAMPYFSAQVDSARFVVFICDKVIPVFGELASASESDSDDTQLNLLKHLAELSSHIRNIENPGQRASAVYKLLLTYMPTPPDSDTSTETPSLEFSHVECLLYTYHALMKLVPAKKEPEDVDYSLSGDELKDFRSRLQYFARGVQAYIKILKDALRGKSETELKSEENQIKVVALRTTSNINTLIKDLFHTPPSYKSVVTLSWITPGKAQNKIVEVAAASSLKRHTPITFESSPPKQIKSNGTSNKRSDSRNNGNQKMYTPPSGKYSTKVTSYVPSTFRGRGGSRGRGGRFNRNNQRGGSFRGRNNSYKSSPY